MKFRGGDFQDDLKMIVALSKIRETGQTKETASQVTAAA
jgi:hypothetical protein